MIGYTAVGTRHWCPPLWGEAGNGEVTHASQLLRQDPHLQDGTLALRVAC